jgi:5-methylcytosine-specific restriction enzyme subunit McrC
MTPAATLAPVAPSVTVGEYERKRVEAPEPTEADLGLAERLGGHGPDPRLEVRWLARGQVEVIASSWVGVARFSGLEVRVIPKLAGDELGVLRMIEYASGLDLLRRLPAQRALVAHSTDLFELLALLLSEEALALTKDGLLRDYRIAEDTITVLRGRLRYRDQYLRRFGRIDQLDCTFDEYDSDIADNQLIAAALIMARRQAQHPDLRGALGRLAALFSEACDPPTADASWYRDRISYGRRNDRYRTAHQLATLVLQGLAYDDLFDTTGQRTGAFLLDMNVVFERFVTQLVHDALADTNLEVNDQHRLSRVIRDELTGHTYTTLRPDLVIHDPASRRTVPIDIKYKRYDLKKLATGDIYQAFLYAYALATDPELRRAGVLYPALEPRSGPRLSIVGGANRAHIAAAGLNIPSALEALATANSDALLGDIERVVRRLTGFEPDV